MPQYKVPQNIFMEDHIIGPLTMWQFLYLLFGGLIDYIAYQFFWQSARGLFFLVAFPTTLLALGMALVKIHDRPLPVFIKNAIAFALSPRYRVWHKIEAMEGTSVISAPTAKKEAPQEAKQLPQGELAKLSGIVDTYGKPSPALPPQGTPSPLEGSGLRRAGLPAEQQVSPTPNKEDSGPLNGGFKNQTR